MDPQKQDTLRHFTRYCKTELNIQSLPTIKLLSDKNWVAQYRSYGSYDPNAFEIKVFVLGRNLADICRSLAHELVHHRQMELDMIYDEAGETGTEIENEANALAGILMRDYGKLNLSVYDLDEPTQQINEAKQVGPLYYFGPYRRLARLVDNGFILTSNIQPFVSFTRNKLMTSDTISNEIRLTVDGNKLSEKYKIAPFAHTSAGYGRSGRDESEERIDLSKYPEGVDISNAILSVEIKNPLKVVNQDEDDEDVSEPPSLESYATLIRSLKKQNIPYKIVDSFK